MWFLARELLGCSSEPQSGSACQAGVGCGFLKCAVSGSGPTLCVTGLRRSHCSKLSLMSQELDMCC